MKKIDKIKEYLKEENDKVIVTNGCIKVIFPEYYFEKKMANKLGEIIETFGIFNFVIYKDSSKNKKILDGIFDLPSVVRMKPSYISSMDEETLKRALEMESINKYEIEDEENKSNEEENNDNEESLDTNELLEDEEVKSSDDKYFSMEFSPGDIFFESTLITKEKHNVENFFNLILSGRMMKGIKYEELPRLLLDNAKMNGINYGVSACIMEVVVSELCRNPNNLEEAYRFIAGKENNPDPYKLISIKKIAQFNSTFTSITFEDFNTALTMSVNKAREHRKETESPMEKIIYF